MVKRLMKWLPSPTADDLAALRRLVDAEVDIGNLTRLSQLEWDPSGLRRLASSAATLRGSTDATGVLKRANIQPIRVLMFSNATAKHLAESLIGTGLRHGLLIDVMFAEYEEPETFIARNHDALGTFAPDIFVLNMDVHAFGLAQTLGDPDAAEELAGRAVQRLERICTRVRSEFGKPIILQTIPENPEQPRFHIDRLIQGSHKDLVNRTNNRIAQYATQTGSMILDVASLSESVGVENWTSPRYWATAKLPFAPEMAAFYAEHLCKLLALSVGKSRRVLVLDLDNTLWGGIVGDDGMENLVLGSGSPVGEAHRTIQSIALSLRDRGIVLCVSSKNEESVALEAFRSHPEMLLSENDIAVFQVNWKDKVSNITALSEILNLGLDSFVFLDDNPAERAQVRFALPDVAVPELPKDVTEWASVFQSACYFETTGFTQEDRKRASYYQANARRVDQLKKFAGQDDYLRSLQMEMEIRSFDSAGRKRIAQLIAKSNQFNLTTKRYSEAEVAAAEVDPSLVTLQVRLNDIFGDNGMISVVIAKVETDALEIDTWLMSCRVLGRGVPDAVLDWLVVEARRSEKVFIRGIYIPSKKNMMVESHYQTLGFNLIDKKQDGVTRWELAIESYKNKEPPILVFDKVVRVEALKGTA